MKKLALILFAVFSGIALHAQDTSLKKIVIPDIVLKDTIFPGYTIEPTLIYNWKLPNGMSLSSRDQAYLKKVYPYALRIEHIVNQIEKDLSSIKGNKKQKSYKKELEDKLREEFEDDVRNLTRIQGQMLCKLVYRQTGLTVYDLLKKYKGGFSAGWWNLMGKFYDQNLKITYDPTGVDENIEAYVLYLDKVYMRNGFKESIQNEKITPSIQSKKRKG